MATITISLPESMHAFVEAQASAEGHGDAGAYLCALIAEAQSARARAEVDAKLLAGMESLERGEGRELTVADWELLRSKYQEPHEMIP